ncbi:MarR family transcriptional regulator [Streptomyces sp. NPDC048606]|uniref:MarR family transcriptional regulator n=1 Tax=Streptomyces sp. NPDC048606 TaxID=3154726 RepID=UPI00343F4ABE
MTTTTTYSQDRLAAQPIGYWSRETAKLSIGAIRAALGEEQLTQPHWWILNHVAAGPGTWTRTALTAKLAPYDDQDTDFDAVHDDHADRGWTTETDGTLTLTPAGEAARARSRARIAKIHARVRAGIDPAEYAATIDVLRRMVANLGGSGDLP